MLTSSQFSRLSVLFLSSEVAETKKDVVATGVIKEGADVSNNASPLD